MVLFAAIEIENRASMNKRAFPPLSDLTRKLRKRN